VACCYAGSVVCLCVLVTRVSPAKMAELIEMSIWGVDS